MAYVNTPNYSKSVMQPFHATPTTCVLRVSGSPHHSHHRFPKVADVRTGTVYGPGQFEQQEYITGTMSAGGGGGTVVYTFVG
jgi:hypothetical protein